MALDRPMDDDAREDLQAWQILWEVRELLLSIPPAGRRKLMEHAIQEANAKHPDGTFEQEVRDFMADIVTGE